METLRISKEPKQEQEHDAQSEMQELQDELDLTFEARSYIVTWLMTSPSISDINTIAVIAAVVIIIVASIIFVVLV